MINYYGVKRFCCEDISLIENYYEAINSDEVWDCHHKLETDLGLSRQELKDTDRYWNVEAKYLIFLTHKEHASLHKLGIKFSEEHKQKMRKPKGPMSEEHKQKIREANKGKTSHLGHHHSEEAKEKIRLSHLGKKRGKYNKSSNVIGLFLNE